MATIDVKYFMKSEGRIQVRVWDRTEQLQKRLPAIVCEPFYQTGEKFLAYKDLDFAEVSRKLIPVAAEFERLYGSPPKGEDEKPLLPRDYIYLYNEFIPWLMGSKGLEASTARDHKSRLGSYVLKFFFQDVKLADLTIPACTSFDGWIAKSVRLYEFSTHHSFSKKVKGDRISASTASAISTTAAYFWEMLRFKHIIDIKTPDLQVITTKFKDKKRKTADEFMSLSEEEREAYLTDINEDLDATPLPFVILTSAVKRFAQTCLKSNDPESAVIAIAGYFALMRPQEIYALMRRYVVTGDDSESHDIAKSLFGIKHRLTGEVFLTSYMVKIELQRDSVGKLKNPKDGSAGVAFIYDEEAFIIFAESLNALKKCVMKERRLIKWSSTQPYFLRSNDHYSKKWVRGGIRGENNEHTTIKDLRRGGIRELATKFTFTMDNIMLLQKLARHKDLGTTQLYMRDPKSRAQGQDDGDIPVPGKPRSPSVALRKGLTNPSK